MLPIHLNTVHMAYVFLSHAHEDKPFARRLAADLRNAGHAVWIDEAEINIGDSLIKKIREGLDQVDFVCAILSAASLESEWVQKELEIASNRELTDQRVVVLPLLIAEVALPGFLQGKLYGNFIDDNNYESSLKQLLRALGPASPVPVPPEAELAMLRSKVERLQEVVKAHATGAKRASDAAFRAKSDKLREAINLANEKFPQHAPINRTYAFEAGHVIVTLDYALWAIAKASTGRGHPLEVLLTLLNQWDDFDAMLEAYQDMLAAQEEAPSRDRPFTPFK